jgi:uncharacterized protein (UPF0276 family)
VDFVEVVAENISPGHIPATLRALNASGVPVIPHGVSLSLGGADPLDLAKLDRLLIRGFGGSSPWRRTTTTEVFTFQ